MYEIDTTTTKMVTITATDGRTALAPEHFANKWSQLKSGQKIIDMMVMQLYRGSTLDLATCRASGVTHA